MKTWKKRALSSCAFVAIAAIMVLGFVFTGCDDGDTTPPNDRVSEITLAETTFSLTTGGVRDLNNNFYTVLPPSATNKNVSWSSSDTSRATVVNGIVTAVAAGTAIITVTADDNNNIKKSCVVTISAIDVQNITLSEERLELFVREEDTLRAIVTPNNADQRLVAWTTGRASIATVTNGTVRGVGAGTTTITATTNNGKFATCTVVVSTLAASHVELDEIEIEVETWKSITLTPTVSPELATDKRVRWTISPAGFATVGSTSGIVTGITKGTATVTATTMDGSNKTATCKVNVIWSPTPPFDEVDIIVDEFTMGSPESEEGHFPYIDVNPVILAQYGLYPTWTNETQHQVTLTKNFIMSAQPVSQVLYKEVTGMNPSLFNMEGTQDEVFLDEWPVDSVNWYEAVEFCNKLSIRDGYDTVYTITGRNPATGYPISSATVAVNWNKNGYRLPTEAEWEYACRAGTETAFNFAERSYNEDTKEYGARTGVWGSDYIWEDWANFIGVDFEITDDNYLIIYGPINYNGRATAESLWYQTVPGFMFADSPNKWDLFLMHGTVEEWCWDRGAVDINGDLIDYGTADQENPEGATTGNNRITRGGSFFDYPIFVRSASRNIYLPTTRMQGSSHNGLPWVGFRIVRNADGSSARAKAAHDAESQTAKQARILLQSIRKHDKNYASLKLERQAFRRKVLGE